MPSRDESIRRRSSIGQSQIVRGWVEAGRLGQLVSLGFAEVGGDFEEAHDWSRGLWPVPA
jgi:hypothetical protein